MITRPTNKLEAAFNKLFTTRPSDEPLYTNGEGLVIIVPDMLINIKYQQLTMIFGNEGVLLASLRDVRFRILEVLEEVDR